MKRVPFKIEKIEFKGAGPEGLERKTVEAPIEIKADAEKGILHVKAYALAFGNVDSWGDVIMPGACDDFLKSADADRMALCWQHDRATVIGKITAKGVDAVGMWIEADILPTTAGNDAAILLKSGAVKEFSIGYRATKYHWEKREGYEYDIRIIDALTVYECSPVTIAANPAAVVVSAKSLGHVSGEDAPKDDNSTSQNKSTQTMTPEEIKAMRESIEKAATEKVSAELKAKIDEVKAQKETIEAQEKSIDNLDKSMKALQAKCDDLAKQKTITDFKSAFRAALEERKEDIKAAFDEKKANFELSLELKTVNDIGTTVISPNNRLSVAEDPTIYAAVPAANAFIVAFGLRPRTANKLGWIEASEQNGADYVAELAQNTNKSDVSFVEKSRQFGKIAHTMRISTEFEDWFEQLYNYCVNEGVRMINAKLDTEIYSGLGNDTANAGTGASPNKIYGLKHYATAFSALGSYQDATDADVLFDAAMQIAKDGFNANVAFVTWATYAGLRGLKDANGNYIFDQARNQLGGLRIFPSSRLSAGEALVADTTVVEIYAGNGFELEFIRNGAYDAYDVYFRKAAQVKVATPNLKGLRYIAALATSKAAITVAGPIAKIAGTVDMTDGAIKTKTA
ncbi:MAG: HK97 family phage prohead protease [Bacteroidales bacterium]|nr:HK97 family phage prohead protease [Bacteroidales bacterium]